MVRRLSILRSDHPNKSSPHQARHTVITLLTTFPMLHLTSPWLRRYYQSVLLSPSPAHRHMQHLLPFPVFMSYLAAPLRFAVCWELQVSAVGFGPGYLHTGVPPADTSLDDSSLCTFEACVRTAQVYTHLLPRDRGTRRLGNPNYFISLPLFLVVR